jgi:eukaryotic-like serine/threonine-protein kinase
VPCRLLPLDGSSPGHQVGPPGAACTFAAWSPEGDWMYFTSSAGGAFHTWRQRFPDGRPEQITSGPTEEEGIAMAPDGRSFITAVGAGQSSIWLHDSRGDRQISLEGQAFQPKFTPDGKRLCYRVRTGTSSELWIAELDSGRSEVLLPGVPLAGYNRAYDISADGRNVVVASLDKSGKTRLWLAPLDRRAPLRQIPNVEGEQPVFAGAEIFFRSVQGTSAFLYRVREDGSDLRKATDLSVIDVFGVSADRRSLLLGSGSEGGWVIFNIDGGAPLRIPGPPGEVEWSGDGKHFFVRGRGGGQIFVLPLSPGHLVPESFAKGFPSNAEMAKLPGVRVIPSDDVAAGPTGDAYAFTRETVQRNLYRIPVP